MFEYKIEKLDVSNFKKCSNIWDMEKHHDLAKQFYKEIELGIRETFVMVTEGNYIAEISIVYINKDYDYVIPNKRFYISRLLVKKEMRNQGIGGIMVDYLINYVKDKHCNELSIGVDSDNYAAIHLYKKKGFTKLIKEEYDENGKFYKLLKVL